MDNPFGQVLEKDDAGLAEWLHAYLTESQSMNPFVRVPHDIDKELYLLKCLDGDNAGQVRFGDAACILLERCRIYGLTDFSPKNGDLLCELLDILQYFPTSLPLNTVRLLDGFFTNERFRGWPSERNDVHRCAIAALATQISHDSSPKQYYWLESYLIKELETTAYACAAFWALISISFAKAIVLFPKVENLMRENGFPVLNLLVGLVVYLENHSDDAKKLHLPEMTETKRQLTECIMRGGYKKLIDDFSKVMERSKQE